MSAIADCECQLILKGLNKVDTVLTTRFAHPTLSLELNFFQFRMILGNFLDRKLKHLMFATNYV